MNTSFSRISLFSLTLLASACTQDQAPVKYLGSQYYGRDTAQLSRSGDYGNYRPDSSEPAQAAASVPSVGVTELPPAGQSSAAPDYNEHIGVSNVPDNDPFKTPPSQPLQQPGQLTPQDKAIAPQGSAAPVPEQQVYAKDGISLIWPVTGGKVIAHFKGVANDGINIAMSEGEPIVAAASGTVVYSGNDLKDYGNMVILRHDNSWLTAYANASRITVKKGAYVKQGDIIAYVGSSGGVKTPQLHFALRKGKVPVDPEQYLPKASQ